MFDEVSRLSRVVVKHARDAFVDQDTIDAQWKALNFSAPPDFARAVDESDRFIELLVSAGARVDLLPPDPAATLDSIYARDASIVSPAGVILCTMGKPARPGARVPPIRGSAADRRPHRASRTSRRRRPGLAGRTNRRRRPRLPHQHRRNPSAALDSR